MTVKPLPRIKVTAYIDTQQLIADYGADALDENDKTGLSETGFEQVSIALAESGLLEDVKFNGWQ